MIRFVRENDKIKIALFSHYTLLVKLEAMFSKETYYLSIAEGVAYSISFTFLVSLKS